MAHLTTINYLKNQGDYYKIIFTDGSFLLIIPAEKEIYYAPSLLGKVPEISDEMIGIEETIKYNGKEYYLANKNDYQFVLKLLVGSPLDIEGECRFSDYFPKEGPKEFLSLGWSSKTGHRADINCQIINIDNINFIK